MKNWSIKKKIIVIAGVLLAVVLGIFILRSLTKEKPVNLDINTGLNGENKNLALAVRDLAPRKISLDRDMKTTLEDISKVYVYAITGNLESTINDLPVKDSEPTRVVEYLDDDEEYYEEEEDYSATTTYTSDDDYYAPTKINNNDFIAFDYQDKDVTSLVKTSPEIRGTWATKGANSLIFTPEKDWLPGQKYTVTLNQELIAPDVKIKTNKLKFSTPEEKIQIQDIRLVKDESQKKKFDIYC